MKYVSSKTTPTEDMSGPAFINPEAYVSFPEGIVNRITYVQMDAESQQIAELPKVFQADSFNAAICHTTSRYFDNEAASMQRISNTLASGGLLSHVR